ncbi:MAG: PEP-CTERM sorting domain-containing protein [Armatimonadota bacterium]
MTTKLGGKNVVWPILAVAMTAGVNAPALCASWHAFNEANFSGISISPAFAWNTLTYNLSLGATPTITVDGDILDVKWVQGFYALSSNGLNTLYAGGGNIVSGGKTTWKWDTSPNDSSPNNYLVAGWSAQGNNDRLLLGESRSFSYTQFQMPGNTPVMLGLHVGYFSECTQKNETAFFMSDGSETPQVPEPPTSLMLGIGGLGFTAAGLVRRRFGR